MDSRPKFLELAGRVFCVLIDGKREAVWEVKWSLKKLSMQLQKAEIPDRERVIERLR